MWKWGRGKAEGPWAKSGLHTGPAPLTWPVRPDQFNTLVLPGSDSDSSQGARRREMPPTTFYCRGNVAAHSCL